ncbi:MAG: glycosyltransferase family 4 protein [Gammaproteobacteria bacterium]
MLLAIDLTLTHGGGQQVFIDFLRTLRSLNRKHAALVACNGWIAGNVDAIHSCTFTPAPSRNQSNFLYRGMRLLRFLATLVRHRALLRAARHIVINDPELFLPGAVIAFALKKRVSLYLHMAYRGQSARVLQIVSAFRSVERIICVSNFVRRHMSTFLSGSARRKLVVIENALADWGEDRAQHSGPPDCSRVALVGRLVPDKGQDIVCELSRRLPGVEFHLVGSFDNADPKYIDRLRRESGDNVKMVGYRHPVIGYLRDNRIGLVLVPSRIPEACPLVPIEAAAAGCAVIVRNLGGLAEVASNIGLQAVDNDEGFYEAISTLLASDPGVIQARIESARRRAMTHYHPARYARKVAEVFADCEGVR